jgi:hypothetical protein
MYLYMRIDTSELLNVQHTGSEKDIGQLHCQDHADGTALLSTATTMISLVSSALGSFPASVPSLPLGAAAHNYYTLFSRYGRLFIPTRLGSWGSVSLCLDELRMFGLRNAVGS